MTPTCKHFGRCGGCSALDVPLEAQAENKRARIARLVSRFVGSVTAAATSAADALHARTKILYPVRPDAEHGFAFGIYARGTHEVVEVEECAIQDPALTEYGKRALAALRRHRLVPYDEATGLGFLRALHARLAPGTGELLVGLVTKGGLFADAAAVATELAGLAEGLRDARGNAVRLAGVVRNLNDAAGNALLGARTVPLRGQDHLVDRASGLELRLSFGSFAQAHREAAKLLHEPALALLGDLRGLTVVDAYGGAGAFGLRAAKAGAFDVQVVESSRSAVRDARHNAQKNRLPRVRAVESAFGEFTSDRPADVLIADPPRVGLREDGAAAALRLDAPRIVLVSCSTEGLVRDLAALCARRYVVDSCRVVDLFPFTEHVEVVTLLRRAVR